MQLVTGQPLRQIIQTHAPWQTYLSQMQDAGQKDKPELMERQVTLFLPFGDHIDQVLDPVGMRDSCFLVPNSKLHQLATYYRLMRDPEPWRALKSFGASLEHEGVCCLIVLALKTMNARAVGATSR